MSRVKKKRKQVHKFFFYSSWLETIKEIKEKRNNHKSELNANKENEEQKEKEVKENMIIAIPSKTAMK